MEDLPSNSDDVLNMMREKIRNQAQRLRILEQYKVLCESRITELSPLHPLPIKPEHIGSEPAPDLTLELSQAKSQIERLQKELYSSKSQVPLCENYTLPPPSVELTYPQLRELYSVLYSQHHKILKENKNLEESLKAEILLSEEQRTYIEVLKQSIEANSYSGYEFKETLKSQDEFQTTSKEEFKSDELKSEEINQSWEERQKADKCLKDAAEALQYAEEEVIRLEDLNKDLEEELKQSKELLHSKQQEAEILKENYKKALKDIDQASQLIEKQDRENKESKEKLEKSQEQYEDLEKEYKKQEVFSEDQEKKIRKLNNDLEVFIKSSEKFKTKAENAQEELEGLKVVKSSLEEKIQYLNEGLKELEAKNKTLALKCDGLEVENKEQRSLNNSNEIKQRMMSESLAAIEKNFRNLEKVNEELKQGRKEMRKESEELQQELKESQQEIERFKLECGVLREKSAVQARKIQEMESLSDKNWKDFKYCEESLKAEIANLRDQIELQFNDSEKIKKNLKDCESLLDKEKTQKAKIAEELAKVKKDYEDSDSSKNFLILTQNSQENKILSLETENNSLKSQKKELLSQLTSSNQRKILLEEENSALRSLSSHLTKFKSQYDDCFRHSSIFCSTFGSLLQNSDCFSPLISDHFKELLHSNNKVFETPLNDWLEVLTNEFESILRNFANTKESFSFASSQLQSKQIRLQELSDQLAEKSEFEQKLRLDIEEFRSEVQKKDLEIEILNSKLYYISNEFNHTKENLSRLRGDYEKIQETSNFANTKILKLKRALDEEVQVRKKSGNELIALQQEKNLLNRVLVRLEKLVGEEDLNVTYEDILRENLNASLNKSAMISPVSGHKSFSYDFHGRNHVMFE